jgi:hypothetical protein
MKPIIDFVEDIKGKQKNIYDSEGKRSYYFNYCFNAMIDFVNDCVNEARHQPEFFLTDIGARFNRNRYLHFVFNKNNTLRNFRWLLRGINKKFLITLDGFDTVFDSFRRESIRSNNEENIHQRALFEMDWLRSLLSIAMVLRSSDDDHFYRLLDFCLAVPKDRFMEIMRIERDSYRHSNRWCNLQWTGIELAILLRKRLEVLSQYRARKNANPEDRLNEVLAHTQFSHIPRDLEFDYNSCSYHLPLFMYVLRHHR